MSADECRELGALISAYADGELEGADLARAEAHLAACDACRGRVEAYREMDSAAADRAGLAAPGVPAEEWDRRRAELLARAARPAARARVVRLVRRAAWAIALGAAAAIIVALLFPADLTEDGAGQGAEVVEVDSSDEYTFAVDGFEDSVAVTFIADAGDVE